MGMRESRTEREWEPESGREMGTNDRREELRRWTTAQKSVAWHSVASIRWAQLFIMGIKRRPVFSLQQAAKSDSERIICSPSNNVGIFLFFLSNVTAKARQNFQPFHDQAEAYVCISYARKEHYWSLKTESLKNSFQVEVNETPCLQCRQAQTEILGNVD